MDAPSAAVGSVAGQRRVDLEGLGINLGYLISQMINFLLLLVILRIFLYKPIVRMLDRRREKIKSDLEEAETARSQAESAKQQYEKELEDAREERRSILAQAREQGEKTRQEILEAARGEAQQLVAKTEEEMEALRKQTLASAQEEIVDLALAAASKVIGASLDEKDQRRLIRDFIAEVGELRP
jgi:F-type H+-transporting ATPase subunit b